jgi:hypothetical protein
MSSKLPPFGVAEQDSSPTVWQPWLLQFPNGTVTDMSNGTVFINTGPAGAGSTGGEIIEARSPLLKSGTIVSLQTDGLATSYLRGDGTYSTMSSPIAYAPSSAYYIVQSNNTNLPNSQQLASLAGGLLKNTSATGVLSIASGGVDYENLLTAGSPVLRRINLIYFNTDGTTSNFLNGAGVFTAPSSGTTYSASAPVIFVGNTIGIQPSATNQDGYLSQSNFNLFNAKASTATTITTVSPLSGGGSLAANRVISLNTNGTATTYLSGIGTFTAPVEARSPLLKAGTILSITTDGTTTNYFRGDGTYAIPASNSGIKLAIFTIYSSASWTAENIPVFQAPYETPITIKQINVTTSGSSPSLGFNFQMRPWGSLANTGSNILASLQSAPTTGIEITSAISSATVLAKGHIFFSSSAIIIGQADYVTGCIYYTRNSI